MHNINVLGLGDAVPAKQAKDAPYAAHSGCLKLRSSNGAHACAADQFDVGQA
jgi:hypothetical protein